MDKPVEIKLMEIQGVFESVKNQGDFNQVLLDWIKNRQESGARDQSQMDLSKFVVNSFDWIGLLLGLVNSVSPKKPIQTHLVESKDLKELEDRVNQFLTQHPMADDPNIIIQPKIGGGYFCMITGRYDTQFSDFIENALKSIGL